jgi:hypothetical protein
MVSFNLKKLNDVEGKEKYHVEISNRFKPLKQLVTVEDIDSAWETIGQNINISAQEDLDFLS